MQSKFYWFLIIVVFTLGSYFVFPSAYAQNEEQYASTFIITGLGLELTKKDILEDNYDAIRNELVTSEKAAVLIEL